MGLLTGDVSGTPPPPGGAPSPVAAGLTGRCPRCGRGPMFDGLLRVRETCPECGLSIAEHDSGDGAAAFVILVLGAVVVPLAFWMETALAPPIWVHAIVWGLIVFGGAIGLLRPLKGVLTALHFRHLADTGGPDADGRGA